MSKKNVYHYFNFDFRILEFFIRSDADGFQVSLKVMMLSNYSDTLSNVQENLNRSDDSQASGQRSNVLRPT